MKPVFMLISRLQDKIKFEIKVKLKEKKLNI